MYSSSKPGSYGLLNSLSHLVKLDGRVRLEGQLRLRRKVENNENFGR